MSAKEKVVIIGGVAAGMSAASSARRLRPDLEIDVFEKDFYISYGVCSVPYYVSGDIAELGDLISLTPGTAETERGIHVFTRHEALTIDAGKKTVTVRNLASEEELVVSYDKLVIATGALPVIPPFPGVGLSRIFTIRNLNDAVEIRKFIDGWNPSGAAGRPAKVVIVGGGYIGMEMCEAFRKRGLRVSVIEKTDRALGSMDSEITEIVEKKIAAEGVELYKETSVTGFEGKSGVVNKVVTDKGDFEADMVLLSIGARPNSGLAKEAGIELGAAGAIRVDEHLRTGAPDVFAAGDCAEALHLVTGRKTYIPLGTTANKQGRIAGENAAGSGKAFEGIVGTAVTKVFDLEVARTGLSALDAEREGLPFFTAVIEGRSRSKAYPAGKVIKVCYVVERKTGRLLGASMVGEEGVAHRIDTLATCLYAKMTVDDVSRLDLAYAPPFATVWDPILIAANVASKKLSQSR